MKLIVLTLLLTLSWFAVRGKSLPVTLPDVVQQPAIEKVEVDISEKIAENLTEEQKQQLEELGLGKGSMVTEVTRPSILSKLMPGAHADKIDELNPADKLKRAEAYVASFATGLEERLPGLCLKTAAFTAGLLALLLLSGMWRPARIIADLLFLASNLLLISFSIIAPLAFFAASLNLWRYGNSVLFWFPAALLLICSAAYHRLDPNYPVWKTLYSSFVLPILSGAVIFVRGMF